MNAGMAVSDLGYRAGVSDKTVRMCEYGFVPGPRIQFAIAAVFAMQPTDLFPIETQRRVAA